MGWGGLAPFFLFISYVFSTELGLDLWWRHCFQNAAAVLTAVDDVELDGREGPRTRFPRSFVFTLGLSAPLGNPSGLSSAFWGRAQHGHRLSRDGLQFSIPRSLLVTNIWEGCLNIWHQEENGKDVMRNGTL